MLNNFFEEENKYIFLMVFTSFIINIFQTNGISYITARIINSIQKNDNKQVYDYFTYFVLISVIYIFLYNFYKFFQNKLLTKLRQWVRHQLVKMLLLVNNENFSEINFTKLNSPINRISSVCFMVFNDIITYLLPNITFLIIISIYFLYKDIMFGVIFIIGNIILFSYLFLNWSAMLEHNEEYEKYVGENESYLLEILNNIDKIIYRGQTNFEIDIFKNKTDKSIDFAYKFYSNTNYHGIIMNIIFFLLIFICIWYIIFLFFQKKINFTIFITFFTIMLLYRDKMTTVIQQIPDFIEFLGRSDSVLKHFQNMSSNYEDIINKKYNNNDDELTFDNIRFENVSFSYKSNNKDIFQNFSIEINTDNKIIGITGLSGNGKSTFAKLILKMYKCNSGNIFIDNINIENIDADYIRKNITFVNQNSKLFDKKIIDNILYACDNKERCNKYLQEILEYPKIRDLYKNIDIYNKNAGSLGENLSGGQRQVANIIGGLVNPSKILILDEPTNALDRGLKQEILELIKDFKKYKKSIIIITHDRDVFNLFDESIQI